MPRKLTDAQRKDRWWQIETAYRRKSTRWTMEALPSMPEDQWKNYLKWVAAFGSGRNRKKFKRHMISFRKQHVTATVTSPAANATRRDGGHGNAR